MMMGVKHKKLNSRRMSNAFGNRRLTAFRTILKQAHFMRIIYNVDHDLD